jgi:hypothetical protein
MKKISLLLVFLFSLAVFVGCQNEAIPQMDEIEMASLDSIEAVTLSKFTECPNSIDTIAYNDGSQLEIIWSLTTTPPVGPPLSPGLIQYEFEFIFEREVTYHTRTTLDQQESYNEFFYWQFLSRSGNRDSEVKMRIIDYGNSSVS